MDQLTFNEIVQCTGGITSYNGEDFCVADVKFDSRDQMEGSVFIAFVTKKDNGHKYVSVAANKGAVAAVVSEDIETAIPVIKVVDTRKAYQDIAAYYRSKFSIPVIGLTGSNGKTTVKDMLTAILSVKYKVLATEKNFNNELGVPQTLLKLDHNYEVAVVEMGMNHKGEIAVLSEIAKPDLAIITKIGSAHIGNLGGTRKDVFDAKMEITAGLKPNGTLILCGDDDMLATVKENNYDVIFSGLADDGRNLMYASDIVQFWDSQGCGLTFSVYDQNQVYHCMLPVLGRHNVQNALLALTCGVKLGVPIQDALDALRIYPRSSMRLETATVCGIRFIKDYYNASPDSAEAALRTLGEIETKGRKIAVLGELLELGEQGPNLHRELAKNTVGNADIVYYVGNYRDEFIEGRSDTHCFADKEQLNHALSLAVFNGGISDGDIILIKGSNGMNMWEQYEFLHMLLERGSSVSAQTRLLVDMDALKHNYAAIKQYVGKSVKVMPVIKADAYGIGADLLANIYNDCDFFAVADLREAEELHAVMPAAKFLVLYQPLPEETDWLAERDYIVTSVGDIPFVRQLNQSAAKYNKKLFVHIEVDTGMSRLGVQVDDCARFANVLKECKNLIVDGIFTHYSSADMYAPEDLEFTALQTRQFKKGVSVIESILGQVPYKHACASAAIFNPKAELFDMVRPGYMLYGYYPCSQIKDKISLKPALKFVTQITQIKEYEAGKSISYGRRFVTGRKTRIAEIPVGYSDGLMRKLSNRGAFVIKGQLAPIVGTVTMDYTMVDVTDIEPMVCAGDEVAVFDNVNMTIEHMAELCDTIGYEIITNIKSKADRVETF